MANKKYKTEKERHDARLLSQKKYRDNNKQKIKQYYYKNIKKYQEWRSLWKKKNIKKYKKYLKEYRNKNKKKQQKYAKKHYKNNIKKYLEKSKKQKLLNPIEYKNYLKKYYKKNKNKIKKNVSKWKKNNKDKVNIINNKRRALQLKAEGSFTKKEWCDLKIKNNFTCLGCYKKEPKIKLTIDHIIPLSKGGTNYISNIQPLCKICNCKKRNKIPEVDRIYI